MEIRPITPDYAVSPQITAADLPAIAAAGFTTVICNRPDSEIEADLQADVIGAAARAAGLRYEVLPLTHDTLTPDNARLQREMVETSDGPVLAYCRSGTRCSVIWAIGQAGLRPVDDILALALAAGYQLDNMRLLLENLARLPR